MSWKDRLHDASFKGQPIKWLASDGKVGRRLAEHEFPQRDRPWVEDMGRMIRPFSFTAVCCGDKWLEELNQLLAVIESPGEGELVHPLFGRLTVSARPASWSMNLEAGGRVDVQLEFIETGDLLFPVPVKQTAAAVRDAGVTLLDRVNALLAETMAQIDAAKARVADVTGMVNGAISGVAGAVDAVLTVFESVQDMVEQVLTLPATAIGKLLTVFEVAKLRLGGLADTTKWGLRQGQAIRQLRARAKALFGRSNSTPSSRMAGLLLKGLALAATLSVADALAGLPVQRGVSVEVPVAADIREVRSTMQVALWDLASDETGFTQSPAIASLPAPAATDLQPMSYAASQALIELHRALGGHLAAVESAGLQLQTLTPVSVLPALVLAYQAHGNAALVDEIVSRNAIAHPLFVPVQPLQVAYE